MGRMHSGAKGKSKSVKPLKNVKPAWVTLSGKEVEMVIAKLAKEGKSPSQIGLFLRDNHGIPSAKHLIGKNITELLQEKGLNKEIPEDLLALIKRVIQLKNHLVTNKKDQNAKYGLLITESKIKRLVKYYKQTKKIPMDWKYDEDRIKMYAQ